MPLLAVSQSSEVHLSVIALVVGAIIGIFGHIIHSRWLILIGILVVGIDSGLFSFVLRPGAG